MNPQLYEITLKKSQKVVVFRHPSFQDLSTAQMLGSNRPLKTSKDDANGYESGLNLLRLCLKKIDGKEVCYDDLAGKTIFNLFDSSEIVLLVNYLLSLTVPTDEQIDDFLDSVGSPGVNLWSYHWSR